MAEYNLSPTFKLVDGVWHLIRYEDLKKGDIIRSFNSAYEDFDDYREGDPVDFDNLTQFVCETDPYKNNSKTRSGKPLENVWAVEVTVRFPKTEESQEV